jgi:hypothetical protein
LSNDLIQILRALNLGFFGLRGFSVSEDEISGGGAAAKGKDVKKVHESSPKDN